MRLRDKIIALILVFIIDYLLFGESITTIVILTAVLSTYLLITYIPKIRGLRLESLGIKISGKPKLEKSTKYSSAISLDRDIIERVRRLILMRVAYIYGLSFHEVNELYKSRRLMEFKIPSILLKILYNSGVRYEDIDEALNTLEGWF